MLCMMGLIPRVCRFAGGTGRYARRWLRECRPSHTSGNPNDGKSARLSVLEQNLQLALHRVPSLTPGAPVLLNLLGCQVHHPPQGIIIGKAGLVLRYLPELPAQTPDNIRDVYDFSNLRRAFKDSTQNFLIFHPILDAGRILPALVISKLAQVLLHLIRGDSGMDFLWVPDHFLY